MPRLRLPRTFLSVVAASKRVEWEKSSTLQSASSAAYTLKLTTASTVTVTESRERISYNHRCSVCICTLALHQDLGWDVKGNGAHVDGLKLVDAGENEEESGARGARLPEPP